MNRARLISTLLGLILLACAAVIYLDQQGKFGDTSAGTPAPTEITPTTPTDTTTPVPAQPTDSSGYGGLK